MFKKLRNRFLFMHMGVVAVLIALFFGSILWISYQSLEAGTYNRMEVLWRAYDAPQPFFTSATVANRLYVTSEVYQGEADETGITISEITRPTTLGLRMRAMLGIFLMTDDNGQIVYLETAYDMEDDFYAHIAQAALAKQANEGKIRLGGTTLQYRKDGNRLAFVDATEASRMFFGMLRSFLMIALPLLAALFWLSLFFANRSIRPIEMSYNRQKEFIADASHEIKTPLATIATNLDVLSGDAGPEQEKWLGYIRSEVGRMAALTNQLLYLAKVDYGAPQSTEWPVDFSCTLEDIWLPLEAALFEKGIDAEVDIQPAVYVPGDGEQLHKLAGILIDNALRYADKKITVQLARVQAQAVLTVGNDGPGIPAEIVDRIWERFYRGDPSRVHDGGFGLGLSMAKAITERHKGRIFCESAEGEWTEFTVRLPLNEQKKRR